YSKVFAGSSRQDIRSVDMDPAAYLDMAKIESTHWCSVGRRAIFETLIKQLNLPQDAKILEIGSGTGGNLHMLAKFGEVSGLEMDSMARSITMEKTNNLYDVRAGYCPNDIPFADHSFDLICMFDVLEHIEEDVETLRAIKRLLKKNGRIFITVPAFQ